MHKIGFQDVPPRRLLQAEVSDVHPTFLQDIFHYAALNLAVEATLLMATAFWFRRTLREAPNK